MRNAGITTQYGFLYQKYWFFYTLLNENNHYNYLTFEGLDDIEEFVSDDLLFGIKESLNLMQVKSGNIDNSVGYKIVGNWLLTNIEDNNYSLLCENLPSFQFNDDFVDKFIKEILDSASCNNTKILKKVYNKYFDRGNLNSDKLKEDTKNLIKHIKIRQESIESLHNKMEEYYISNYTGHIKIFEDLKVKSFNVFLDKLNRVVDDNLKEKHTTTLSTSDVNELIVTIVSEINDKSYKIDIEEFHSKVQDEIEQILNTSTLREVQQLRLVNNNNKFIAKNIVNKLLYDDFRSVFQNGTSIKNIEYSAFNNYDNVLDDLLDNEKTPMIVYQRTMSKPIYDDLLPKNEMYYKGCYIFLTSDDAPNNKQISWEVNNDTENK